MEQNKYIFKKKIISLLLMIAVLLTGCGEKEEKLNSYRLEEIRGNQVVFAHTYSNWNVPSVKVWIFNKYGQCKVIDLRKNPEVYQGDEKRFLANLDACMVDDKIPFLKSKLELPDEKISYCINLPEIEVSTIYEGTVCDASGETFYVVSGVKENRQLKIMKDSDAYGYYACENEMLKEVCQAIYDVSRLSD